jgi:serine/threonine-protein kinase
VDAIAGTPAFIAPEQALRNAPIDGRADIYALGCVAYWLLTGQQVFTADTPIGVLLQHVQSPPVPPSRRTTLPIPAALEDIVLTCLAKAPEDRPQSAKDLARRLASLEIAGAWTE